jgi:uncharacterized protein (DUF302 family)
MGDPSLTTPLLHAVESTKSIDRVARDLDLALVRRRVSVLAMHDLKETLARKGVTLGRECRIFEICDPLWARHVLETRLELSTVVPWRISVYREGPVTRLAALRPTALPALYGSQESRDFAVDVDRVLVEIMDEAAR